MEKINKKLSKFDIIFNSVVITILAVYSIFILFLLLWGFNTSLKSSVDFLTLGNVLGLPDAEWSGAEMKFGNYLLAFKKFVVRNETIFLVGTKQVSHATESGIWMMLFNTLVYVLIGAFLPTITCFVTAFLCSKYKFKFSNVVYVFAVFMMSVPTVGTQPAMINMLRSLGIYDTYFTHVFQKLSFGGMYFFVFYAFFESLPDSYTEAAEIDGASQLRTFVSVIAPLGVKFICSVALIHGVQYWNDYQAPLLYTPTLPTLSYGVYWLVNKHGNAELKNIPAQCACCMILAIPILVIFLCFRNKLMGNVTMGGIKG